MLYSIRLTDEERRLLEEAARVTSKKRSDVVREAIAAYCAEKVRRGRRSALDCVADRVGCARSGRKDLGSRSHEHYREALIEKRRKSPR